MTFSRFYLIFYFGKLARNKYELGWFLEGLLNPMLNPMEWGKSLTNFDVSAINKA